MSKQLLFFLIHCSEASGLSLHSLSLVSSSVHCPCLSSSLQACYLHCLLNFSSCSLQVVLQVSLLSTLLQMFLSMGQFELQVGFTCGSTSPSCLSASNSLTHLSLLSFSSLHCYSCFLSTFSSVCFTSSLFMEPQEVLS